MPVIFDQIRGLSDSKWSGIAGSVYKLVGVDIHSTPGLTKVHQKLAKDSASVVDALCRVRIAVSDGASLWFSYTTGKIWRESSGTYTLVYTTTPAAGNAGCLGAEEFDGFIYWATQSRLHRIATANTTTAAAWTANAVEDWATFTNTDAGYHPMVKQNLQLFIGDANYVSKVSGATGSHAFTANALDLKSPIRIKTLITFDIDILIGTLIATTVNSCEIIRWDTESESWLSADHLDENGVNCFIQDDNYTYIQAGQLGRIYVYDGAKAILLKRIPGDWSPSKTAEVYPQASAMLLGIPRFGLSNVAGNPTEQGVYSLGSYSPDYPKALDLSFIISPDDTSSIEIGALLTKGADLWASWYDGTNYGVDKLDYTAKYASAYIETMMLTPVAARHFLKTALKIFANYASLPASTAITIKYKKQHETNYTTTGSNIDDTKLMQIRAEESIPDVATLQLRIEFTVSSNNAPELESLVYEDNVTE